MNCIGRAHSFPYGDTYNYHCAFVGPSLITINCEVKTKVKCTLVQAVRPLWGGGVEV